MKNLVEQASSWLQSEPCRSGSIQKRTDAVISLFRSYLSNEKDEIEKITGLSDYAVTLKIDKTQKEINQILSAFLRGNQQDALQKTHAMMKAMRFDKLGPGRALYKSRENGRLFHFTKDEMFHIPYDKRSLVGNQRFSLSGLPCLYLGGSSYICWEELGRKDFSTSNYCGYSLKDEINMFDMLLPTQITNPHQVRRIVLILACSLAANREQLFKPEYILSQCILHVLINRSFYNHSLFCVRFYSTHLLNGDADYFEFDYPNEDVLSRYINYVFPAASSKDEGYSEELKKIFHQTETISLMHETLLRPGRIMSACSGDIYLDSQFGLVDAILDEYLGLTPKRREGDLIFASKS
jgi:hypothetical protein